MLGGTFMRFFKHARFKSTVTLCLAALLMVLFVQPGAAQRLQDIPVSAVVIRGNALIDTAIIQRAITRPESGSQPTNDILRMTVWRLVASGILKMSRPRWN